MEVCLDGADNLGTIAINMYLVDVVQHCVGLVTIAWAQLEEQDIADSRIGESQNLSFDLGLQCHAISSGHCEIEVHRLEVVGAVLQGLVKDGGLNLSQWKSAKIICSMECHEVIPRSGTINHGPRHLGKLNVVLYLQGGETWWFDIDQGTEVKAYLNSNKLDVWPTTIRDCTIDDWQ